MHFGVWNATGCYEKLRRYKKVRVLMHRIKRSVLKSGRNKSVEARMELTVEHYEIFHTTAVMTTTAQETALVKMHLK
jgi:hypothetical protein